VRTRCASHARAWSRGRRRFTTANRSGGRRAVRLGQPREPVRRLSQAGAWGQAEGASGSEDGARRFRPSDPALGAGLRFKLSTVGALGPRHLFQSAPTLLPAAGMRAARLDQTSNHLARGSGAGSARLASGAHRRDRSLELDAGRRRRGRLCCRRLRLGQRRSRLLGRIRLVTTKPTRG
jgi:hypothetical protein